MGISHEVLDSIIEEFPDQVEESKAYAEIEPAVREEYLLDQCEGDPELIELFEEMIDSVRILARNLKRKGKNIMWFDKIDKSSRVGYAVLALSTTYRDILKENKKS